MWGALAQVAPLVILNEITQELLRSVWQIGKEIWLDAYPLTERKVRWGGKGTISSVAQPGLAIKGTSLAEHLLHALTRAHHARVGMNRSIEKLDLLLDAQLFKQYAARYDWIIDATGRSSALAKLMGAGERQSFGERCILTTHVLVTPSARRHACWLETVIDGWVFGIPTKEKTGGFFKQ